MTLRRPDGETESLLVRAYPGLCEAWGNCHRWAPHVYALDGDGKIDMHLLEVPPEHAESAWLGAQACPAGVIQIVDIVVRADGHAGGALAGVSPRGSTA